MTKYTKRQYLSDLAANEADMAKVNALLDSFNDRLEAGEALTEELSTEWNNAYDRRSELEAAGEAIEYRFRTRNWTWQDHSFAELVSANID